MYPTVVGPRYAGGTDAAKDKWIANPHLPTGTPEPYRFDVKVHMETSIPIKELSSPSHQITVKYPAPARADVALAVPGGGNRDFVLRYRLSGDKIESGLLLWEGEGGGGRKENFFALMMEPPQRPQPAQIPPREYIFLLDVSGSMHGYPLDTAKALMRNLLGRLRPTDTFNVALFSGAAKVMFPEGSRPAAKTEVENATGEIERQQGGGGTELMGGLEMSYRIPKRDRHASRTVVVVTDGYVGVEAQAFRFIRERLSEANLFAFGIGSSVNRGLIEGMARAGQGEPFVVLSPDRAAGEAEKLRAYVEQPVLTHVNVAFAGLDAYGVSPPKLPDLMARRPLVLYGKYRGAAGGRIDVSGQTGGGAWRQSVDVRPADVRAENAALRWLWARNRVATLEDDRTLGAEKASEDAITTLGLDYRLLTAFTSFVAIDSQVVNKGGQQQNVRQPLPMPEGVSDKAVAQPMFLRGTGAGVGGLGLMKNAKSASAYGLAGPMAAPPLAEKSEAKAEARKDRAPKAIRWIVAADKISALENTSPLLKSIETLLASRRAACAAAVGNGTSVRLRLTVDVHGKVLRVDILGGDRSAAACVVKLLTGTSSATKATGAAVGTVEVTITSR